MKKSVLLEYVLSAALALAKADERVAAALAGKTIKKEIVVPGKIVNFVAI